MGKVFGPFRLPDGDGRILPGTFANVIVSENGKRVIKPMRFQIRPYGSNGETNGVYNAKIESLTIKDMWRPLFTRKHALVPFTNFYEWVADPDFSPKKMVTDGLFSFLDQDEINRVGKAPKEKKKLITFYPENRDIMWAPCLWDEWVSNDGKIHFKSFAIITNEPPVEVSIMGHDRCPIFLSEDKIDEWLSTSSKNPNLYLNILRKKETARFIYEWAL